MSSSISNGVRLFPREKKNEIASLHYMTKRRYYALHGGKCYPYMSVYESVATNRFQHGRTEPGRTVTNESATFVLRAVSLMMRHLMQFTGGLTW